MRDIYIYIGYLPCVATYIHHRDDLDGLNGGGQNVPFSMKWSKDTCWVFYIFITYFLEGCYYFD